MPIYQPSILVSNILDPLTHNEQDLCQLYQRLGELKRYASIETRIMKEASVRAVCDEGFKTEQLTFWITGELSRAGLNLSSVNESNRLSAVEKVKEMMQLAALGRCTWLGIASGGIETTLNEGIDAL